MPAVCLSSHLFYLFFAPETTIIESLKYAITGALPPGARSGQSFVHDPKAVQQTHVKASVKLRFSSKVRVVREINRMLVRRVKLTHGVRRKSFCSNALQHRQVKVWWSFAAWN